MNVEFRGNKKQVVPQEGDKYFHYYPQAVVVVGVIGGDTPNFAPCSWNTGLSYEPFMYGVSIGLQRFTHGLLEAAEGFVVNFVGYEHFKLVLSLGRSSGEETNKAEEFGVAYTMGDRVKAPIMDLAYYSLECRKTESRTYGDHTLFVGMVELMHISEEIAKTEILEVDAVSPLLYLGMDHYITTDETTHVSLKDLPFHYKIDKKR